MNNPLVPFDRAKAAATGGLDDAGANGGSIPPQGSILDKERRRGWRAAVWATPEEAELLMSRFASEHEVGEISPAAWAALKPTSNPKVDQPRKGD